VAAVNAWHWVAIVVGYFVIGYATVAVLYRWDLPPSDDLEREPVTTWTIAMFWPAVIVFGIGWQVLKAAHWLTLKASRTEESP